MIFIIIACVCLIIGIVFTILYNKIDFKETYEDFVGMAREYTYKNDIFLYIAFTGYVIFGVLAFICSFELLIKPKEYKDFKIKYNTVKQMETSKDDLRDASYTQNLIEINSEINHCREYIDSPWSGIFQNKKICEMEILGKEDNNGN